MQEIPQKQFLTRRGENWHFGTIGVFLVSSAYLYSHRSFGSVLLEVLAILLRWCWVSLPSFDESWDNSRYFWRMYGLIHSQSHLHLEAQKAICSQCAPIWGMRLFILDIECASVFFRLLETNTRSSNLDLPDHCLKLLLLANQPTLRSSVFSNSLRPDPWPGGLTRSAVRVAGGPIFQSIGVLAMVSASWQVMRFGANDIASNLTWSDMV